MRIALMTLNSKFIHSSLALRYLRSAVARDWPNVDLLEFQVNDDPRALLAEIGRLEPDILACSCYIWNVEPTLALLRDLRQVLPETRIILGGPEVGARPLDILRSEPAIDYVISGEGEAVFGQLLRALTGHDSPPLSGVFGREHPASNRYAERPLDPSLIPPAYLARDLNRLEHRLVYVETSRGCPFGCSYCLSAKDRLRQFPLPRVFQELDLLLWADVPLVKFVDRTFNADQSRALTIWRYLLANRKQSRFHFEICADLLTEEALTFLATVPPGVFQFEIGIQSTDPVTLSAIGRRMHWDKLTRNIQQLQASHNIHLHLDLIAGLPYQGWEGITESFDQVMQLCPDQLQLGFLKVLPGTPIAEQTAELGFVASSRPPYEVLRSNWLSFAELNQLHLIEQLLEDYYNSGLLRETLPYIWTTGTRAPFQLFSELAEHWQRHELQRVQHSQDTLLSLISDWLPLDPILKDLLQIDRARTLPSFQAQWRLPEQWRANWEDYLNQHLDDFSPRTYKQALRSVFPIALTPATLDYYRQPPNMVAVVDQRRKRLHGFVELG